LILRNKYTEMHGQQNIKKKNVLTRLTKLVVDDGSSYDSCNEDQNKKYRFLEKVEYLQPTE